MLPIPALLPVTSQHLQPKVSPSPSDLSQRPAAAFVMHELATDERVWKRDSLCCRVPESTPVFQRAWMLTQHVQLNNDGEDSGTVKASGTDDSVPRYTRCVC